MSITSLLAVFFRWLHIVTACIAVGGVFFMRIVLPPALSVLDPETRKAVFLRARRIFKMVIHTAILLFLISGIYNAVRAMQFYNVQPYQSAAQALLGIHMTLAIVIFGIAIYLLMGPEPPKAHRTWMIVNLLLMIGAILAGGGLKIVRERAMVKKGIDDAALAQKLVPANR